MQKKKFKQRYKINGIVIWMLTGLLILFGIGYVGVSIWSKYKTDIIDKQKEQMLVITQTLSDNMEKTINDYIEDLNWLGNLIVYNNKNLHMDELTQKILENYLGNGEDDFVTNVRLIGEDGNIEWCGQDFSISKSYVDSHFEDENIAIEQGMGSDNNFYFMVSRKLESGQTIELYIDLQKYYKQLIKDIKLGTNGYIVVKNSDGIILMHPEEAQIGKSVIEGREKLYEGVKLDSLKELIEVQNEQEQDVSEYYSYWWLDSSLPRVKKIAAWSHTNLGDQFVVVSAVMDYSDIYDPILSGFTSIILTAVGVIVIFFGFLAYFSYLAIQRRKNREEIDYLKNLNHVLEETKRGEEAIAHQQRLQIMGTMTGGIAHEFNNLLTPIMGYSEMLMDTLHPDSEEYDFAQEIFDASDKAKDIIRQIAGLSRKNMETVFSFVAIDKMIKRAMKMIDSVCPSNIKIKVKVELNQEGFLGNATQMNQVLLNLCVNAFHAIGKEQQGELDIAVKRVDREEVAKKTETSVSSELKNYICISVKDNGCGMDKQVLEQIFNPFFTMRLGGQGTGLGLSIVEQIIHSHKGYIIAESIPGKGSTFYVYLPLLEKNITEVPKHSASKNALLRMMVIDDNGKILRLLERKFKRLGVNITTVTNTEEAREKLKENAYDVLLIDQNLSKASSNDTGISFAMSINAQYPNVIKILMVDQIRKEVIEAKQHGIIDAYCEKPVSDSEIILQIKNINDSI